MNDHVIYTGLNPIKPPMYSEEVNSNPSEYTNYGDGFDKGYEDLYLEKFKLYLGSCSRYMMNQRLKDEPYRGENGAFDHG